MFFLAVDPGINNCGLCVGSYIDNKYHIHKTHKVNNLRKLVENEKTLEEKYDLRSVKVLAILQEIKKLIDHYGIKDIIIEAPFYNSLTPNAFGSLLEVIYAIKYSIAIPNNYNIILFEPLNIKKQFTTFSQAKKHVMKEFLLSKQLNKEILHDEDINFDTISEHEIDAIAVGYCFTLLLQKEKVC